MNLANRMRCFPSGMMVDPCNVTREEIDVVDVAHHLSLICRFTGAVRQHYSVAQHSCLVATILAMHSFGAGVVFAGLMHDTPEYLLGDCGTPLKKRTPDYRYYEDKAWEVFVDRFAIDDSPLTHRLVKAADMLAFVIEARALQGRIDEATVMKSDILDVRLVEDIQLEALQPAEAKEIFLRMFASMSKTKIRVYDLARVL